MYVPTYIFEKPNYIHFWVSVTPCAFPLPRPSISSDYSFLVDHPVTRMTGISLHMQWPLTSQSHGSILKENNCFVFFKLRIKLHAHLVSFITYRMNYI
jgi:hypothetical protein